jgi:DNA gyrase/topoisomerase IV subunit B
MNYDANSIQIRDFRTACRATPSMYLGDDRENGIFNCFLEILNNACDEAIMKRGDKIEVFLEDNSIKVIDHGAGIPRGPNKDCQEVLIELFTKAHSSGKFNTNNYKKVRGLHGVGSSAVCVCSSLFEVWSKRDGYTWNLQFKDGIPQAEVAKQLQTTKETGTTILFVPDKKIFHLEENEKCFDYGRIKQELELTSYFIPKVSFELNYNGKKEVFLSKNGLRDFAEAKIQNGYKEFDDEVEVEVFAQWTSGKEQCYVFSNGALNSEGGTPVSGAKAAFTRTINGLLKKNFDSEVIRKGLVYIINVRHPNPIYQNQIKNKIQNTELRGYTQTVFTESIKVFASKYKEDFEKVKDFLSKEEKAEAAADRARLAVLSTQAKIADSRKKKMLNTDKLKDAEFLGENSILLIVEGNSAMAGLASGRNTDNTGLLAIRGRQKLLPQLI